MSSFPYFSYFIILLMADFIFNRDSLLSRWYFSIHLLGYEMIEVSQALVPGGNGLRYNKTLLACIL